LIFRNGMGGDGVKLIEGLQDRLGINFEIVDGCFGVDEWFANPCQYYYGLEYRDANPVLLVCNKEGFKPGAMEWSGFESIQFFSIAQNLMGMLCKNLMKKVPLEI